MAEPATTSSPALPSSGDDAMPDKRADSSADDAATENPRASRGMTPSSFPAVNSKSAAGGGSAAVTVDARATISTSLPQPPPSDPTVAQTAPQTEPPSSAAPSTAKTQFNLDDWDGGASGTSLARGTRSRNRTGNARPNYAEDQDMDFENSSAPTTGPTKRRGAQESAAIPQAPSESKRNQDAARFVAINNTSNGTASTANGTPVKESTPGASTHSSTTKKRKATAAASTLGQAPQMSSAVTSATTRKVGTSSHAVARETNIMTFTRCRAILNKKSELVADDGTKLSVNDHVYLVCEPPGDPYYLCRIMQFLHVQSDDPSSPVDSMRVNWYYRPRDVLRFNNDSRLVYGTMHSDVCPVTSLRGKCTIKHRSEIDDLDAYRKERDAFYFSQVHDRFIRRWYECIPVSQIINVPETVKRALDERWKFVIVEVGRVKELTSAVKTCKRCAKFCASNDSVDCAICKNSYHMNCVQPPLPKKPSRGFAWACGPCSRASERKQELENTPNVSGDVTEVEEEELLDEEQPSGQSNDTTRAPSPVGDDMMIDDHPATQAEVALAKMWPYRYLGIHCRVEDALQYDDRAIYPRASSRLGPRHQANIGLWYGRPVELVKTAETKKRYNKGGSAKKDSKLTKETIAAIEAEREERAKRPKWVQDEPQGYVARGEDYPGDDPRCTARLIFTMPEGDISGGQPPQALPEVVAAENEARVDEYIKRAKQLSRGIGVPPFGGNFLDKALELLSANNFDQEVSLKQLAKVDRVKDLHEPVLSKADLMKFEEGVAKYGSEHRLIRLHMKTSRPHADIVRFYYLWKKTPKGKEIWGNFGGRKNSRRKIDNDAGAQLQQSVADDADDSAFDNTKAIKRGRDFQCKYCNATHSRQWRKAPGVAPGQTVPTKEKGSKPVLLALCLRCANLWRKYALQWEDVEEMAKKMAQGGGKAWKRRIDEELLREITAENELVSAAGLDQATAPMPSIENGEPPKKKSKTEGLAPGEAAKKKEKPPPPPPKEPTPPPPPIEPAEPVWRELPCSVCRNVGDTVSCDYCKLTVHLHCFGLTEQDVLRSDGEKRWACEQCTNDRNPQVSTDYACCLCLTEETQIELVEPPKVTHKKKTDRDREKERLEKELADAMRLEYQTGQISMHRPPLPREPLKRTTGNNWVHVYCAVWTPEIRFSEAKKLEVAEGFQQIPPPRHEAVCKLCKNRDHKNRPRNDKGACVSCFQCQANFHVSCAFEAGYTFGFDVTPVKGSRKDHITTAKLGEESGAVTAGIWCKEHVLKTVVHSIDEIADDSGKTALQVFCENYKQADLTLTGTVRKANLAQLTKDKGQQSAAQAPALGPRRESAANSIAAAVRRGARTSSIAETTKSDGEDGATQISDVAEAQPERRCLKCGTDVTPRWHLPEDVPPPKELTPPKSPRRRMSMTLGEIADENRDRANGGESNGPPNRQNIRFMAPGASGRAWEGMPDRYGAREQPPQGARETAGPEINGAPRPRAGEAARPEVFHNHALPQYQNVTSTAAPPSPAAENGTAEHVQEFLCHQCFLKQKLNPTPSQPERKLSPPRLYQTPIGWNGPGGPPPQQATFDHRSPLVMPWDNVPSMNKPPLPPTVNGLGMSAGYPPHAQHAPHQPPPPPPGPSYPPYGQPQPNGYHPAHPPPHHASHVPPGPPPPPHHAPHPSMHERQASYGYGPHPPPPQPSGLPQYAQHQHRPPPVHFHAQSPLANGLRSPLTAHSPPMHSPTHPPPPHAFQSFPPRRPESPFRPAHLPPIGQPTYSTPPVARPDAPPPAPPHHQQGSVPGQLAHQPTPAQQQMQSGSPHTSQVRPESRGGRPTTPHDPSAPPGVNSVGARASPSVKNLLL